MVLIKAVAAALPYYCMSVFLLPKEFCYSLDVLFKNFWWSFSKEKTRNFHPKPWADICVPKDEGGLGLRKMYDLNRAMVAKLGWQVLTDPKCLWVQAVSAKYLRGGSLLAYQGRPDCSWVWRGGEKTHEIVISNLGWKVNNGWDTLVCSHPWVPGITDSTPKLKNVTVLPSNINCVADL